MQTCGTWLHLSKFVDVLSVNLEFPRLPMLPRKQDGGYTMLYSCTITLLYFVDDENSTLKLLTSLPHHSCLSVVQFLICCCWIKSCVLLRNPMFRLMESTFLLTKSTFSQVESPFCWSFWEFPQLHRTFFFMGTPCSSQPKRSNLKNLARFLLL